MEKDLHSALAKVQDRMFHSFVSMVVKGCHKKAPIRGSLQVDTYRSEIVA